jgi:hypothetical protein
MIAMVLDPISLDKGDNTLFERLKKEHDLAKAVKNNNAEVPLHLWDTAVWAKAPNWMHKQEGNPTDPLEVFKQAMTDFTNSAGGSTGAGCGRRSTIVS